MSIQDTLDHHMEALVAGDIDEVMKDYADDAVMITGGMGSAEGLDALRAVFSMIPTEMFAGFEVTETTIAGDAALVTWKADGLAFGADSFQFSDGKIITQTVVFQA
jgi:ketosteroid isomerase-like protein